MKTNPRKIYGLIGYPVKHSLSPAMHNAAFQSLGINAEYRLFELKLNELEGFFKSLSEKNILGLNVTIPYKEKVIPFLDKVSDAARLIGSVNTVRQDKGKLEGYNTDGAGFLRHLTEDLGFNPQGKTISLLGAGGAARALGVYLCKTKPLALFIYDIDKLKGRSVANHLKKHFPAIKIACVDSVRKLHIRKAQLLVNATPVGMKEEDPLPIDESSLHKGLLVYDLIYNPKETSLLKIARKKCSAVSNGLGMLLYQGAQSFEVWTGRKAPVSVMQHALNEGVKKL